MYVVNPWLTYNLCLKVSPTVISNAPTKAAPIPSFTAESKMIIDAKAPSIILNFCTFHYTIFDVDINDV